MVILPAIDLKGGRCVRLLRGDMDTAVVYGDDPVAMACRWVSEGAEYLHVVDLDGAVTGRSMNSAAVRAICAAIAIPVEVGGGVRDAATARELFDAGVSRVILGTVAHRDPDLVTTLCQEFPGRIAVGIDARGEDVAVQGWTEQSGVLAVALAEQVARVGVACVIYTDISRDGTQTGPNLAATRTMARALASHGIPLIASGGVGELADVLHVAALEADGVHGLIIGRALYTGALSLRDAMRAARSGVLPPGAGSESDG